MQPQDRLPTPEVLEEKGAGWTEKYLASGSTSSFSWGQYKGEKTNHILGRLLMAQTNDHCSFCDQFPMQAQSRVTIEHFRPKAMGAFPELAFEWTNLFYCCDRCQQKSGSKAFVEGTLKPDEREYEFNNYFTYNVLTGEIELNPFASQEDKKKAQRLLDRYDLNEEPLVNARKNRYVDTILLEEKARPLDARPYRFCYQ